MDNNKPVLFRKTALVRASQWFKMGDHPNVVAYYDYERQGDDAYGLCVHCGELRTPKTHGWIETLEGHDGAQVVCPGDWIITGIQGEHYPCKPDIFSQTYELANVRPSPWVPIAERPKVVCFCGSTRYTTEMLLLQWEYAKKGIIVHTWHALPFGYKTDREAHIAEAEGVKELLDELHHRKIDLSDEVLVINIDGYIGESTRGEINYAESIGKPVKYLEPIDPYTPGAAPEGEILETMEDEK